MLEFVLYMLLAPDTRLLVLFLPGRPSLLSREVGPAKSGSGKAYGKPFVGEGALG